MTSAGVIGERITHIARIELFAGGAEIRQVRAKVTVEWPDRGAFRAVTNWGSERPLYLHDEGVTWIRDWHDEDSPEMSALRAAFLLAGPKGPKLPPGMRT